MIGAANVGDLLDGVKDVVEDGIQRGLDEAVDGLDEAADEINYGITNQVQFSKLAGWRRVNYRTNQTLFLKMPILNFILTF